MINIKKLPKVTMVLIFLYVTLFVLDKAIFKGILFEFGSGKNFNNMEINEWYRLLTGSFFHHNILHLLGNVFAIYFVGNNLENKLGNSYFLLIYLIGNTVTSLVLAKNSYYNGGCGASPGIYALIACILILHLHIPKLLNLRFGTWSLNYTVWYFFLGNFIGLSTLISHSLGFSFGIVVSTILLITGVFKL